jgi:hypothetical protein
METNLSMPGEQEKFDFVSPMTEQDACSNINIARLYVAIFNL